MAKIREFTKDQAHAAGREARLKGEPRIIPEECESGEKETAWFVGYDQTDQAINVKNGIEKPKQEFIFPGPTKDDPPRKQMI
jgi:hypothetical protein